MLFNSIFVVLTEGTGFRVNPDEHSMGLWATKGDIGPSDYDGGCESNCLCCFWLWPVSLEFEKRPA